MAVILGNTSFGRGCDSVISALFLAFNIGVRTEGLILAGMNGFMRHMTTAVVIVIAVFPDCNRNKDVLK